MAIDDDLVRLNPFEGLCLLAEDLRCEQTYHQRSLERHAHFLSGHGVVQGLSVDVEQRGDRYEARIRDGFGLTALGQGVHLPRELTVRLEEQQADGDYTLWLVREERPDPDSARPVFDLADRTVAARIVEAVVPRLLPSDGDPIAHGVAVAHLRVRLGRIAQLAAPVPRAGRVLRAAESALKPDVVKFVELNRELMQLLFRTAILQELSVAAFGFYAALVSAEFLLIEEGTADRVLYRTAGTLIRHGRSFYDSDEVRSFTDRVLQVADGFRSLGDGVPAAHHDDRKWQEWFVGFQQVVRLLARTVEEVQATVDPGKERGR